MSMDIRTSTDKRLVPNTVLIRLREELGWGLRALPNNSR